MDALQASRNVFNSFKSLFALDSSSLQQVGRTVPIPTFEIETIVAVCDGAKKIFEHSEIILHLKAPFYIVGDIHGNIFDLIRILVHVTPPPESRLLFLGDYVDRGEYSVEVMTLLFAMTVLFPEHVYLLRGNHEFESMNSAYGFAAEVSSQYPDTDLFEVFNGVFLYMPLIAILNNEVFCVHGGISPEVKNISRLRKLKRPLLSYDVAVVSDLVWSDPCSDAETYDGSVRGLGVQFGVKALQEFLTNLKLTRLLRAHQCVPTGIARFGGDLLYTVFSCSRYEGQSNSCGLLFMDARLELEFFSLPPFDQIPRATVLTRRYGQEDFAAGMQGKDSIAMNISRLDMERVPSRQGVPKVTSYRVLPGQQSLLQNTGRRLSAVLKKVGPGQATGRSRALSLVDTWDRPDLSAL
jgi:protein phosphatase